MDQNKNIFIQENVFENVDYKLLDILLRSQTINIPEKLGSLWPVRIFLFVHLFS